MIRVRYDNEDLSGELSCSFCGGQYALPGNVHWSTDESGLTRTVPDARLMIYSHFHYDQNAHLPICPEVDRALRSNDATPWEALDKGTRSVVARGRILVEMGPHSRGPITVLQDEPEA